MQRRIHLATGLVLLAFVVSHFLSHAVGVLGLPAALEAGTLFYRVWGNPVSISIVALAFLAHASSALVILYRRRDLGELYPWEQVQLGLGLMIPPLLVGHLVVASYLPRVHGAHGDYIAVLHHLFVLHPLDGLRQLALSLAVWVHVAIGIWARLRIEHWFPRWSWVIFAGVVGLPALGIAGVFVAGREVVVRLESADWQAEAAARAASFADASAAAWALHWYLIGAYVLILAGVFAARLARDLHERRMGLVRVRYPDGRAATQPPGRTILEASRSRRFPHASVCGGRGRCSTCRVRVLSGAENLSKLETGEVRVLSRLKEAGELRLACQARVYGDIEIVPLVSPDIAPHVAKRRDPLKEGQEREIAVLFADLRGFTGFSEHKLPYDVVFVLNRFARGMHDAIERAGGRIDKFLGDGLMALFGTRDGGDPCREALSAAVAMQNELEAMNDQLSEVVGDRFRLGIGIHFGPAIVGEIGFGAAATITAIGDTVNTASRLEQLTKTIGTPLVVSRDVLTRAGLTTALGTERFEAIRGRSDALCVVALGDLELLAKALSAPAPRDQPLLAEAS